MSEPLLCNPLLQATGLACERDDRILFQGLNVSILPGTLTRVEGPNGSGKTTLLRILAGLHNGYSGEVFWCGEPRAGQQESFFRNLLYIGHRPGVKPVLTAEENLQAAMAGRRPVTPVQVRGALESAGLGGFTDVPCRQLSAGQQRRVALARLLLSDEPLWILDEAFTAIDHKGVEGLEQLLVKRAATGGAILVTTHHLLELPDMQWIRLGQEQTDEF